MSDAEAGIDGLRAFAERVVDKVIGHPGVVRLQAVLDTYDLAGGGLVAAGLAYTSLLALLPGMLLGLSVVGILVRDPADQERLVTMIGQALPPLEDLARAAFAQVSAGAVPTGIIATVGFLWGASRFYANLDTAFSRIFRGAPRRNPVLQTVRGIILTAILVVIPVLLLAIGSLAAWLQQFAPDGVDLPQVGNTLLEIASPIGSLAAFFVAVAMCYRFVPAQRVGWRSLFLPALAVGLVLALFTQIYVFIAPRLVGVAAFYGAFVALFALLAWLSVGFNVLLIGAAWTDVRSRLGPWFEPAAEREGASAAEVAEHALEDGEADAVAAIDEVAGEVRVDQP